MLQKRVEDMEASQKSREPAVKRETSPIRVPFSSGPEVIDLT